MNFVILFLLFLLIIRQISCLSLIFNKGNYTCITQTENAITWISPLADYFTSTFHDANNITENIELFGFEISDESEHDLQFITDFRWEYFQAISEIKNNSKRLYYFILVDMEGTLSLFKTDNSPLKSTIHINSTQDVVRLEQKEKKCTLYARFNEWVPVYVHLKQNESIMNLSFSTLGRNSTNCSMSLNTLDNIKLTLDNVFFKQNNNFYYKTNNSSNRSLTIPNVDFKTFKCLSFFYALGDNCSLNLSTNFGETKNFTSENSKNNKSKWKMGEFCPVNRIKTNVTISTIFKYNETNNDFWALDDVFQIGENYYRALHLEENLPCMNFDSNKVVSKKNVTEDQYNCTENRIIDSVWKTDNVTVCCNNECYRKTFIPTIVSALNNTARYEIVKQSEFNKYYLFLLIFLVLPIGIIFYTWKNCKTTNKQDNLQDTQESHELLELPDNPVLHEVFTAIKAKDFIEYITDAFDPTMLATNLDDQFERLENTTNDYTATVGAIGPNRSKNRYECIIPYDETRVRLKTEDQFQDYINASYIKIDSEIEYIATQNPLPSTALDFCKMIWDENITHIIAVSNPNMKTDDLYPYWPDHKRKSFQLHPFTIELRESQQFEYFISRKLRFTYKSEIKEVTQYHYNTFPTKGQPLHPHVFIQFFQTLTEIPHFDSPVLVHSKSGTQTAGFMILCDKVLRSRVSSIEIDIYKTLKDMRNSRMHMVNDIRLYKLVHLVVAEYIHDLSLATNINESFSYRTKAMIEHNGIKICKENLEIYKKYDTLLNTMEFKDSLPGKNRYTPFIAADHSRVKLQHVSPNYINAMFVSAYRRTFITTQQPLPTTLVDFYIMVLQQNIDIIVNLNTLDLTQESSYISFWPTPEEPILKPMPEVQLKYKKTLDYLFYEIIKIDLYRNNGTNELTVISMKNWDSSKSTPNTPDELLSIFKLVKSLSTKKHPTALLTCDDGISACGLLVATFYVLEKINYEKKFDVESAVRVLRHSQTNFINEEQLKFLYICALHYQDNGEFQ